MPDWQGELESLLATLNVSLEEPSAGLEDGTTFPRGAANGEMEPTEGHQTGLPVEKATDTAEIVLDVVPVDGEEISAVQSEIEATLRDVLLLVRAGRMDRELRDDVVFVLEALTRPRPGRRAKVAGPDDSSTEWNLASAAAVLRFCRIVLRLTNSLARGEEL